MPLAGLGLPVEGGRNELSESEGAGNELDCPSSTSDKVFMVTRVTATLRRTDEEERGWALYGEPLMKPNIDRRKLILTAFATGCLASLTPEALAQVRGVARATGRPLLTTASLARAIPPPNASNYGSELQAAADDLPLYLRARFTLTADQERFLAGLTPADIAQFRQSLMNAIARGDLVRVEGVRGGCEHVVILAGPTSFELQNRGAQMGNFETPTITPQQTPH